MSVCACSSLCGATNVGENIHFVQLLQTLVITVSNTTCCVSYGIQNILTDVEYPVVFLFSQISCFNKILHKNFKNYMIHTLFLTNL